MIICTGREAVRLKKSSVVMHSVLSKRSRVLDAHGKRHRVAQGMKMGVAHQSMNELGLSINRFTVISSLESHALYACIEGGTMRP
jgi:hypothetical protein